MSGLNPDNTVAWTAPETLSDRSKLDNWCETVGPAIFRPARGSDSGRTGRLLVVNWNVHVGNGEIERLIQRLTDQEGNAGFGRPHFVFLLQEAFRRGHEVPSRIDGGNVPSRIESGADDIRSLAEKLDWWMFYAPSMRNGREAGGRGEDRGNAILSSLPLAAPRAFELPFSVQRRVALAAEVRGIGNIRFQVATVHLDTRAPLSGGFIFGAPRARNRQAKWLSEQLRRQSAAETPLILAGDLNSVWGPFESSPDTFAGLASPLDCGGKATHSTGLSLDKVFAAKFPSESGLVCRRMDDRFASDHYPLVITVPHDTR